MICILYRDIQVENHQFHQDHTIPQAFAAMTTEPFACSQLHHVQSPASEMTALNDFIVTNKQQKLESYQQCGFVFSAPLYSIIWFAYTTTTQSPRHHNDSTRKRSCIERIEVAYARPTQPTAHNTYTDPT